MSKNNQTWLEFPEPFDMNGLFHPFQTSILKIYPEFWVVPFDGIPAHRPIVSSMACWRSKDATGIGEILFKILITGTGWVESQLIFVSRRIS